MCPATNQAVWQLSSEPCGHKRSSSWGRTYSFTSAVSRGCVLEDEDRDVKAGAQAALQVSLGELCGMGTCGAEICLVTELELRSPLQSPRWRKRNTRA